MTQDSYLKCGVCGRESTTSFASSLATGWEKCCGYTMRLERTDADIDEAVGSIVAAAKKKARGLAAGAALTALLALPAIASAHSATITCDQERPGQYVVVTDYAWLDPVTTFGPTGATVTWRDGYVVRLPYPAGCAVPEPPVVVPPSLPVSEEPASGPSSTPAPPVVKPCGPVEPMPRKVTKPRPRKVTCALLNRRRAGVREYTTRGWYFRCKAPVPPRKGRPYHPPVTG